MGLIESIPENVTVEDVKRYLTCGLVPKRKQFGTSLHQAKKFRKFVSSFEMDESGELLYFKPKDGCKDARSRVVDNNDEAFSIFCKFHLVGHSSFKDTLHNIYQTCYWIGMEKDIKRWIDKCEVCIAKKKKMHEIESKLLDEHCYCINLANMTKNVAYVPPPWKNANMAPYEDFKWDHDYVADHLSLKRKYSSYISNEDLLAKRRRLGCHRTVLKETLLSYLYEAVNRNHYTKHKSYTHMSKGEKDIIKHSNKLPKVVSKPPSKILQNKWKPYLHTGKLEKGGVGLPNKLPKQSKTISTVEGMKVAAPLSMTPVVPRTLSLMKGHELPLNQTLNPPSSKLIAKTKGIPVIPNFDTNSLSFLPNMEDKRFLALLGLELTSSIFSAVHAVQHFRPPPFICSICKTDHSPSWTNHILKGVLCHPCTNVLRKSATASNESKSLLNEAVLCKSSKSDLPSQYSEQQQTAVSDTTKGILHTYLSNEAEIKSKFPAAKDSQAQQKNYRTVLWSKKVDGVDMQRDVKLGNHNVIKGRLIHPNRNATKCISPSLSLVKCLPFITLKNGTNSKILVDGKSSVLTRNPSRKVAVVRHVLLKNVKGGQASSVSLNKDTHLLQ